MQLNVFCLEGKSSYFYVVSRQELMHSLSWVRTCDHHAEASKVM